MGLLKRIVSSAKASPAARDILKRTVRLAKEAKRSVENWETSAVEEVLERAKAGDSSAQFDCGEMYFLGSSVPQDDAEAAAWFQKAAEQNHGSAQLNLARLCALGRGVRRDDIEAYKWAKLAAEQGNSDAPRTIEHLTARMSPEQIADAECRVAEFTAPPKGPTDS